jgi:hypothetical protein
MTFGKDEITEALAKYISADVLIVLKSRKESCRIIMELWRRDATFYPSPKLAAQAAAEKLAYVGASESSSRWSSRMRSASSIVTGDLGERVFDVHRLDCLRIHRGSDRPTGASVDHRF